MLFIFNHLFQEEIKRRKLTHTNTPNTHSLLNDGRIIKWRRQLGQNVSGQIANDIVARPASSAGLARQSQQNAVKQVLCLLLVLADVGVFVQAKHLGVRNRRKAADVLYIAVERALQERRRRRRRRKKEEEEEEEEEKKRRGRKRRRRRRRRKMLNIKSYYPYTYIHTQHTTHTTHNKNNINIHTTFTT